jgi:hypothetical protein
MKAWEGTRTSAAEPEIFVEVQAIKIDECNDTQGQILQLGHGNRSPGRPS